MSSFITKGRLISMASASAMIATMAVATAPTAALAAGGESVAVRGETLTALIVNPTQPVTGTINADGYDVAVYFGPGHSGTVDANISGAKWYGVVADRANVTVTGSQVHNIGDSPLSGAQHGNAIFYYNGANGTISGNRVWDYQKNGITVSGKAADGIALSDVTTSASVVNNVVTGEGHIDYIAQNGIQISYGANGSVKGNTVSHIYYNGDDEAAGLLSYDAGKVTVSGNTFVDTEVSIYGAVTANVLGYSTTTVRPHGVRIDLFSNAKPAPQAELGSKLDWKVKVDGRVTFQTKQTFGDHDVVRQPFTTGSGRHVVKVIKNGVMVQRTVVRF